MQGRRRDATRVSKGDMCDNLKVVAIFAAYSGFAYIGVLWNPGVTLWL